MDKQVNESELEPKEEIQELVRRSREAQKQIENYTQEQVDELYEQWFGVLQGRLQKKSLNLRLMKLSWNYEGKFLKIQRKTRATLMDIIDEKSVEF